MQVDTAIATGLPFQTFSNESPAVFGDPMLDFSNFINTMGLGFDHEYMNTSYNYSQSTVPDMQDLTQHE